MKKLGFLLSIILLIGIVSACGKNSSDGDGQAITENKLTVGVTAGPHEQIVEVVKEVAAKDGLEIDVKSFSDYILPNSALSERRLRCKQLSAQTIPRSV